MSTIKTGWLKDNNGDKFAPKTLSSQVIASDGVNLEDKIEAQLNEFRNDMANKDHNHNDLYETKGDAQSKFDEAKAYADSAAATVKNDLLNGAGEAYDTLKELGELIDENQDAIGALETVAANKADKEHTHDTVYYTKEQIDAYEFITVADIDAICGASIVLASEVMF